MYASPPPLFVGRQQEEEWWLEADLNRRPHGYEPCALNQLSYLASPLERSRLMQALADLQGQDPPNPGSPRHL